MNVQAIWENGVLRPLQPLHLKHAQVTIQVPDEELPDLTEKQLERIEAFELREDR